MRVPLERDALRLALDEEAVDVLRDELDRLRRRTFPTFTHIENRASADRAL